MIATYREIREVMARLELLAGVSAAQVGQHTRDASDSIGGRRPAGVHHSERPGQGLPPQHAAEERDDYRQWPGRHTADSLRRRLEGAQRIANAQRRAQVHRAILEDGKAALREWLEPKPQPSELLEPGSLAWKRAIAADARPIKKVAASWSVSERAVSRYRERYGRVPLVA